MSDKLHAQTATDVRVVNAGPSKVKDDGQGNETWVYKITLQNTTIKDLTDIEVRCRVFKYDELNPAAHNRMVRRKYLQKHQ